MVTDENIEREVKLLNEAASRINRGLYEYRKGDDGSLCLFNVKEDTYRPVWLSKDKNLFFAYISLLKKIYLRNPPENEN